MRALPLKRTGPTRTSPRQIRRTLIPSIALAGMRIVLFDNVSGSLGSPALDAALTGTTWSARLLGTNTLTAPLPLFALWYATGNNLSLRAESDGRGKVPAIPRARPGGFEPGTYGLEEGRVSEELREVNCDSGPFRDRFQQRRLAMLEAVAAGRPVRRRDAVALAREVLESEIVRAAEAVLEADDATFLTRLLDLLRLSLEPAAATGQGGPRPKDFVQQLLHKRAEPGAPR